MSFPGVLTVAADGVSGRWHLGQVGHLTGISWSSTLPGGDEQFSATLQIPRLYRHPALTVGRILQVVQAGQVVFEGRLDRPAPSSDGAGWDISAHGAGTYGSDYQAIYSTYTANDVLNGAISRGLRWSNPGMTGGFLADPTDSGMQTVTEFLDAITSPGSEVWQVRPPGNVVTKTAIPTAVTRILVTTTPAAPDLVRYVNALYARYQATADTPGPATYGLASSTLAASIAAHGRTEAPWDLTAAGVMSSGTAAGYAASALAKYVAASFSQSFTVTPGHYLTTGGVPVDLACERAGEVVRLILAAGGFGGEILPAWPITFPAGAWAWSEDDQAAQLTPLGAVRSDLTGLLASLTPAAKATP